MLCSIVVLMLMILDDACYVPLGESSRFLLVANAAFFFFFLIEVVLAVAVSISWSAALAGLVVETISMKEGSAATRAAALLAMLALSVLRKFVALLLMIKCFF